MKKRLLSLLLALAMLASLVIVPVSAETPDTATTTDASTTDPQGDCPCGCGKSIEEITWTPWDVNGVDGPTSGHYYLDGDYTQDDQKEIMRQIAEFVINDGAINVMDLNEIDTDLWRRGVISFTAPVLAEEMMAMSRILLRAA